MYLVTAEQMRRIDSEAINKKGIPSLELMENAGRGIAEQIQTDILSGINSANIILFCGNGNNGGDGFVIARYLKEQGHKPQVYYPGPEEKLSEDCAANLKRAKEIGVTIEQVQDIKQIIVDTNACDLVVDAIFGTGFSGAPRGVPGDLIRYINDLDLTVVSVDLPSGLNADNGQHQGEVVSADYTYPLALPKYGLYVSPGRELSGKIRVVPIGIPENVIASIGLNCSLTTSTKVTLSLPKRDAEGHKGTFGKLLIVAGSLGMTGAAALAAKSALRSGCGMTKIGCPSSVLPVISTLCAESTGHPLPEVRKKGALALRSLGEIKRLLPQHDALVLGPGLGQHHETAKLVYRLVAALELPTVVDADGLNAIARNTSVLKESKCKALVLTPHPGEFQRLTGEEAPVEIHERISTAVRFATEFGIVLVLKGSPTIIANSEGKVALNPTGNHGMATGGSGDVLSGIIGSLLAQGMGAFEAATAGVYIHGLAGDLASDMLTPRSVIASDILDNIPDALMYLEA
ncbi:MAG: NAD(P)H-hydrate dehydratase [bacterium]|nr:NAD(P)H-hydrate dehydratase [bacterium]